MDTGSAQVGEGRRKVDTDTAHVGAAAQDGYLILQGWGWGQDRYRYCLGTGEGIGCAAQSP